MTVPGRLSAAWERGEPRTNGRESSSRDVSHNIICNTGGRAPATPRWGTAHLSSCRTSQHGTAQRWL
ncbi:hypothetical protein E2C01_078894 [Portunus trituberculatus]|uniref:Uncharacterized protein n=1 Tax=Portunus trituberculatus TaxID=210409 RepID=A0A5B7IRC5_PORTR|nr:hypothetical protein [Portunus trituberculatus]